jgi:TPR repeat protein
MANRSAGIMKTRQLLALAILPSLLGGCFTPFIEGATEVYDHAQREQLRPAAASGDPVAQYELGNSYCCRGGGPLDAVSIYDNKEATRWFCRAARQGYGPAQLRLARIYAGHPVRGPRIAQHLSAVFGNPRTDITIALMWANVSAESGIEDAVPLRDDLAARASKPQRQRAAALQTKWRSAPCGWTDVFHNRSNASTG